MMKIILLIAVSVVYVATEPPSAYLPPGSNYLPPQMRNGNGRPNNGYGAPNGNGIPSNTYGAPNGNGNGYSNGNGNGFSNGNGYGAPKPTYGAPKPSYGPPEEAPAKYAFEWEVNDPESGNEYGQKEERDGDKVVGQYNVLLPDGRRQIVEYEADEEGYRPKVTYEEPKVNGGYPSGRPNGNGNGNGGYRY